MTIETKKCDRCKREEDFENEIFEEVVIYDNDGGYWEYNVCPACKKSLMNFLEGAE